jgi:hypothetical protein
MTYCLKADATFDATNIDEAFLALAKLFEAQAQERKTSLEYKGTISVEVIHAAE